MFQKISTVNRHNIKKISDKNNQLKYDIPVVSSNCEFEILKSLSPLDKTNEAKYNRSISNFAENINKSSSDPQILSDSLDDVVKNLDNIAVSEIDNLKYN